MPPVFQMECKDNKGLPKASQSVFMDERRVELGTPAPLLLLATKLRAVSPAIIRTSHFILHLILVLQFVN